MTKTKTTCRDGFGDIAVGAPGKYFDGLPVNNGDDGDDHDSDGDDKVGHVPTIERALVLFTSTTDGHFP